MKKISKLLKKSNLTPRERVMTLIKNHIHRIKTGEGILSKADEYAISKNWQPKQNYEVQEYNKYLKMWDLFLYLEIDMQTVYFNTLLNIAEMEKVLLMYYFTDDVNKMRDPFEKQLSDEEREKAYAYILKRTGLEYDMVVHRLAFRRASKALRDDMESLNSEAQYDASYFNEEEQLACILKDKKELSEKDVDDLTALFTDTISWERVEFMESHGLKLGSVVFRGYFAGYAMINFAHKLAKKFNISYEDERDLETKVSDIPNLRHEIEIIIHDSIEDGLFFDEYVPLCNSDEHDTYEGKTKLKHKVVLEKWLEIKQNVIDEIQSYIHDGTLLIEQRNEAIFNLIEPKNIITGESIASAPHDLPFKEEYLEQVDILMVYGFLFEIMEKRDVRDQYGQLLTYKEMVRRVSDIVGESVTESPDTYLRQIDEKIQQLDLYTRGLRDQMGEIIYMGNKFTFPIDRSFDDFAFDMSNVELSRNTSLEIFDEKMTKKLKAEWTTKG